MVLLLHSHLMKSSFIDGFSIRLNEKIGSGLLLGPPYVFTRLLGPYMRNKRYTSVYAVGLGSESGAS